MLGWREEVRRQEARRRWTIDLGRRRREEESIVDIVQKRWLWLLRSEIDEGRRSGRLGDGDRSHGDGLRKALFPVGGCSVLSIVQIQDTMVVEDTIYKIDEQDEWKKE